MANQQLYTIGNATNVDAQLTSSINAGDNCKIPANTITHTGGSDGDYIRIPDCSGSQWYGDHHILVQAVDKSWTVSFWSNDQENGKLYWSPSDAYFEGNPLPGSDGNWHASLQIKLLDNGNVSVGWSAY